jgi:hypothetical protein
LAYIQGLRVASCYRGQPLCLRFVAVQIKKTRGAIFPDRNRANVGKETTANVEELVI